MNIDHDTLRAILSVLLPIVPAFILYKFLQSKAFVKGPVLGFTVNLAGAFGGYFIVMIVMFAWFEKHPLLSAEVWTVEGKIVLAPKGTRIGDNVRVEIVPAFAKVEKNGTFEVKIPVIRQTDGSLKFPQVTIEVDDQKETVNLDEVPKYGGEDYKLSHSRINRTVSIGSAVKIDLPPKTVATIPK